MSDLKDLPQDSRAAIRFGRQVDWTITIVIMVVAVVFILLLQSLPLRATFFPWFITISILTVGSVYAVGKLRNPARWDAHYDPEAEQEHGEERDTGPAFLVPYRFGILRALAIFIALVLGTIALGPKFAVPIFVTLALWLNGENKIAAVLSGLGFWLVIQFVFGKMMSINLPVGYLTDALGF